MTFDQPLYVKAVEMVELQEDMSNVIVRLGGFYLLMFFLGAVGYIMAGSGLEGLWETIYAKGSVCNMLTGKSYARALRANFLKELALSVILMKKVDVSDATKEEICEIHVKVLERTEPREIAIASPDLEHMIVSVERLEQSLTKSIRTAKLWCQYLDQISLIRHYIRAEVTGSSMFTVCDICSRIFIRLATFHMQRQNIFIISK